MDTFNSIRLGTDLDGVFDKFNDLQDNKNDKDEDDLMSYLAQYTQSPLPSPSFFSYSEVDEFDTNNRATVDIAYSDSDATPNTPLTPYGRSHLHFWFPDVVQDSQQHQQQQQPQSHQQQQQPQSHQQLHQQPQQEQLPPYHTLHTFQQANKPAFKQWIDTLPGGNNENINPGIISSTNSFQRSPFESHKENSSLGEFRLPTAPKRPRSLSIKPISIKPECPRVEITLSETIDDIIAPETKQEKGGKPRQSSKKKNSSETKKTPGRKKCTSSSPVELHKQRRLAANARERKRMRSLNVAFDKLRQVVPSIGDDQILSKYDTLQMAQTYINALLELLDKDPEVLTHNTN